MKRRFLLPVLCRLPTTLNNFGKRKPKCVRGRRGAATTPRLYTWRLARSTDPLKSGRAGAAKLSSPTKILASSFGGQIWIKRNSVLSRRVRGGSAFPFRLNAALSSQPFPWLSLSGAGTLPGGASSPPRRRREGFSVTCVSSRERPERSSLLSLRGTAGQDGLGLLRSLPLQDKSFSGPQTQRLGGGGLCGSSAPSRRLSERAVGRRTSALKAKSPFRDSEMVGGEDCARDTPESGVPLPAARLSAEGVLGRAFSEDDKKQIAKATRALLSGDSFFSEEIPEAVSFDAAKGGDVGGGDRERRSLDSLVAEFEEQTFPSAVLRYKAILLLGRDAPEVAELCLKEESVPGLFREEYAGRALLQRTLRRAFRLLLKISSAARTAWRRVFRDARWERMRSSFAPSPLTACVSLRTQLSP